MAYSRRMGMRSGSKRMPRHLRNEDLPRDTFTHRTYQVELLDTALHRNTMVCMDSHSGRMFIAVMLMKELADTTRKPIREGGKRSVFLVDRDEEVVQQTSSIQHPVELSVLSCTDQHGSPDWSAEKWAEEINRCEVLVMTGSQFLNLLSSDILSLSDVNLFVMDECHHVLKDHPYKEIMKLYSSLTADFKPRILSLTSNIFSGNFQNPEALADMVTSLEKALQCTAETSTLVISERYGIKPAEKVIECEDYVDTTGLNDIMYELLEDAIDFLEECKMEITEELDHRDPCLIAKAALIECHNILTQLGPWCAACLADMLVSQIEKIEKQKEFVALHKKYLKLGATKLRMISKIFDNHFKKCDYSVEELLKYSTPKVTKLMDSLRSYKPETEFVIISEELDDAVNHSDSEMSENESDFSDSENEEGEPRSFGGKQIHVAVKKVSPEDEKKQLDPFSLDEDKYLCGIVFVDNQHEAYALNKFVEEVCSWDENLCFVKSSHITAYKSSANKEKKLYKKQEEILRKFRMQELNLLISTSVLEEGVDIPKCNFVVRFDIPKSYKSYSQSKGRARARDAEYIILVEGEHYDEFHSQLKSYKHIEEVLIRRWNRQESDPTAGSDDPTWDTDVEPFVPSMEDSEVKVTLDTSIMLINRYCAKLPSDAFTHLTPTCNVREVVEAGHTQYVASLRLPINSPVKEEIEGLPMGSRLKARQSVALKMCEILHKQGELDDKLMPVGKEMFQGDDGEEEDVWDEDEDLLSEARPGTTKRKQYYCKKVATFLLQSHPLSEPRCNLYTIDMKLTGPITDEQNTRGRRIYAPEETHRCFGILTSKFIPLVPMFPVFTRSGEVTVAIDLLHSNVTLTDTQLASLKMFHKFLFSNVLRLEKDPMDFDPSNASMGYLVVPLTKEDDELPLEIDWKFTQKVESSQSQKPKDPDMPFSFVREDYEDAVVMPSYRNIDQPQYFYVAEIRTDLNPLSPFPSPELYKTFAAYYTQKYGLTITNMEQPLLDVDHTSARLNLLIPRYMNQKGVPLPTSSAETKKARRENLQQKQILVPELCDIHVFLASLWRKAVCLPAILYRMNYLLLAEEIRKHVATETKIGVVELEEGFRFPRLDFGFDTSPENLKLLTDNKEESDKEDKPVDDDMDHKVKELDELASDETEMESDELETEDTSSVWNPNDCDSKDENQIAIDDLSTFQDTRDAKPDKPASQEWTSHVKQCDTCKALNTELDICDLNLTSCPKCAILNSSQDIPGAKLDETHMAKSSETDCGVDEVITGMKTMTFTIEDTQNLAMNSDINSFAAENSTMNGFRSNHDMEQTPKIVELSDDIIEKKNENRGDQINNQQDIKGMNEVDNENEINTTEQLNVEMSENLKNQENGMKSKLECLQSKTQEIIDRSERMNEDNLKDENCTNSIDQNGECLFGIEDEKESNANLMENESEARDNTFEKGKSEISEEKSADKNISKLTKASPETFEKVHEIEEHNGTEASHSEPDESSDDEEASQGDIFSNVGKFEMEKDANADQDVCKPSIEEEAKLAAQIFQDENIDLSTFVGPSPCIILQALTMSNANDFFSLERLETIGDSFLKYAITVYLYCSYPGIHEGKLSYLRSKQVSNYNLYRLGKRKSLAECMISTKFEPYENWLPPGYVVDEDKRKGPVPKVHVANQSVNRSVSAIFSSQTSSPDSLGNEAGDDSTKPSSFIAKEVSQFNEELEEADFIAQAMEDEEYGKTEKCESQQSLTPYNLQLHHCLPDKSIADCVEALIGCYLTSCGKMAALRFMSWMGLKVLPKRDESVTEDRKNGDLLFERLPCPQSPFLCEAKNSQEILYHLLDGYKSFEQKIGYKFNDRSYLLQAFTHASYHYNTVTDCYQRLEFLGDAVLDYVITRHLYEDSDKYSPGVLTDLRSALVNNNIFAALAVKWDFHKYFKAISPALFHVIEKFVTRQKDKEDEIDIEDDEADHDHEKEHVELEVPKALGDIFESVAGAIYLDSGMSLEIVWNVFYRIMSTQIDKYLRNIPKSPVRELLEQEPETAKFDKPERTMDGKIRVTVNVVGKGVFTGVGRNYRIAKSAAAKKALRCIKTYEAEGLI